MKINFAYLDSSTRKNVKYAARNVEVKFIECQKELDVMVS